MEHPFDLTVYRVNVAPEFKSEPDTEIAQGAGFNYTISIYDEDEPAATDLQILFESYPAIDGVLIGPIVEDLEKPGGYYKTTLQIDSTNLPFQEYWIQLTVDDDDDIHDDFGVTPQEFWLSINSCPNGGLEITAPSDQTINEGTIYLNQVSVVDGLGSGVE